MARKRLFIIDGHALAYRTYFALTGAGSSSSQWVTRSGEPTAGTYGFTAVLFRLLEQETPDYLAVSFDISGSFRDDIYADYKGTREKMPAELRVQIERIREVVQAFDIPVYEMEGYEADDVIGTISRLAPADGVDVVIVTGDRDLLQLATKHVSISLSGRKLSEALLYGPAEVEERYGVRPEQFVDYKALVGDKSDNIPGVAGVGDKTAMKLLQQYGTLDGIYENVEEIITRFRNKLEAGKDSAYLSQKLAAIVTDLDVEFDLEACTAPRLEGEPINYDRDKVAELFRELQFRSLLNRIPDPTKTAAPAASGQLNTFVEAAPAKATAEVKAPSGPTDTVVVHTPEALAALVKKLKSSKAISFDTETTSTNQMTAQLVGIALAIEEGQGYYIPVGHLPEVAPDGQLPLDKVLSALEAPLTNPKIEKYAHNAGYDYVILKRAGLTVQPLSFDTLLAEWLCDPGSRNLGLQSLTWVRLDIEMTEIKELIGSGKKQKTMDQIPVALAAPYAVTDVDMTLQLVPILRKELKEKGVEQLLAEMEMPLVTVLAEMEMAGVLLDPDFLAEMSVDLQKQLTAIEKKVFKAVGHDFNLNSTQQLSKALFDELEIIPPHGSRRTASGHYSTAANVLNDLAEEHEVVRKLLEHREFSKLKSTYVDALPLAVNAETSRIHTSYNLSGSVTGRIASSSPSLQNIPIRTELGRQVRRAFIAPRGRRLVAVDYAQIELRVAAHLSDDEFLKNAFAINQDIHAATAAAVFNVGIDDVTSDQRRTAKVVNFGLIYGMGAFRLAQYTGITLGEAEEFIEAYFERLPGIKRYLADTLALASKRGYVETMLGRRRYFPILQRPGGTRQDQLARSRAEREAVNAPIQGTAADIIKLAMIELGRLLPEKLPDAQMLLQVHNELVFECHSSEVDDLIGIVRPVMEGALKLNVALKVEAEVGMNWYEMKDL